MIRFVRERVARTCRSLVVLAGVVLLSGCGAQSAQPLASPDPNSFSGPLMGFHQMVASAYLDNTSKSTVQLVSARPVAPYNVDVVRARVVSVRVDGDSHGDGLWGAFRWPRTASDDTLSRVFDQEKPVKGFLLPARSRADWMVTLQYRQRDERKSMRVSGVVVDYTEDGAPRQIMLQDAFCFTTPTDARACTAHSK